MEKSHKQLIMPGAPYTRLEEVPEGPSSLEEDLHLSLRDSLESDTESLAQERRYQFELQKRIHQNEGAYGSYEDTPRDHSNNTEEEEEEEEEGDVYDSLDEPTFRQVRRGRTTDNEDQRTPPHRGKQAVRRTGYEDDYAELRYNPNWRENLGEPRIIAMTGNQDEVLGESYGMSEESPRKPWEEEEEREGPVFKDQKHAVNKQAPAVSFSVSRTETDLETKPKLPSTPYLREKILQQEPSALNYERQSKHKTAREHRAMRNHRQPEPPREYHRDSVGAAEIDEGMNFMDQQSERSNGAVENKEQAHYSEKRAHKSNVKQVKPREDFVERNKVTLGRNAPKQGSYLHKHSQKRDTGSQPQEVLRATEEPRSIGSRESPEEVLDPEDRWQQRAQELQVQNKVRKAPERGGNNQTGSRKPPRPPDSQNHRGRQRQRVPVDVPENRHQFPESHPYHSSPAYADVLVIDNLDSHQTSPLGSYSSSMASAMNRSSYTPLKQKAPTVNLNINLNTSSDFLPFVSQDHQQTYINLAPPHDYGGKAVFQSPRAHSKPRFQEHPNPQERISPCYPQQFSRPPLATPPKPHPSYNHFQGYHDQISQAVPQYRARGRQRQDPTVCDHHDTRKDHHRARFSPPHQMPSHHRQNLDPWSGHLNQPSQWPDGSQPPEQRGHSYTVLPPIGHTAASDSELRERVGEPRGGTMQRSSSEGYLAQMEKQKQLKEGANYKAYTLRDYKNLKQDVQLGGLGQTHQVSEETAEKIKRQRHYSNQVKEQNMKMNKNPYASTRKPQSNENTEDTPRKKALEYARNIPKPKPPPQPRGAAEKLTKRGLTEHARYLEDLDLSQLATLEMLQRRHEEEKQIVSTFKALHVA
ncbi:jhy protein homolog [Acipenser ruthenus]|uniref:jhy protein homolog n=1 Tax=Acipenser ruthenus TaxID=7906 RepID=UPI0027403988|nr:jhy protein homolog [Acipenser ruthenus]